jgi:hypothetical protein
LAYAEGFVWAASFVTKPDRNRDLSLIRESGSTARVVNLALIHDRFGDTPEFNEKPLFKNKRLNRSVLLKHSPRPAEKGLFQRPRQCATKIVVPFASSDLRLGGASFMVDQTGFERTLRESLGGYNDATDFNYDLELLRLLDSLPSFDPFLMRERLRQSSYEPARCYFEVSEADVARMRVFVGGEIAQLVGLAFANGGAGARELSAKLADKLMTDETAKSLDPLRETLRLSGEQYREGVFAWKGFLYYKWLIGDLTPQLTALKAAILATRVMRPSGDDKALIVEMRARIVSYLDAAAGKVNEALGEYAAAFGALSEGKPTAFRDFLLKAPTLFIPIGEAVGVMRHIESFWRFRFPGRAIPMLEAEEAIELFQDFDLTLESVEFIRARPAPGAAAA